MRLYTLTSDLHGELAHSAHNEQFIKDIEEAMGETFDYRESDFSDYGAAGDIIYVRTGGTEGIFRQVFEGHEGARVRLLTSGQSNSLAASMEILSWLNQQGLDGEIIHGSIKEIANELMRYYPATGRNTPSLVKRFSGRKMLAGKRFGVVGHPSDWLISSAVDYAKARKVLGAELIDIPMSELISAVAGQEALGAATRGRLKALNNPKYGKSLTEKDMEGALQIYAALKQLIEKYRLDGLTLRCFDLLTAVHNTGCLALAMLNADGYIATCEGDIPAMLSMAIVRTKYGKSGFQVNLSRIAGGNFLFAHCTVPLDMVTDYCYDTHFESGIGVAIHGQLPVGPARLFKLGADLEHCIDERVNIIDNPYGNNLCRTQVVVRGWADRDKEVGKEALRNYMLHEPLGNHHILITQ
ncbi:MAG: hypothetical protein IKZ51_01860 [Bacteroidales bacterium]|nr:hypothetical protein [Bacteroidales bacterium]